MNWWQQQELDWSTRAVETIRVFISTSFPMHWTQNNRDKTRLLCWVPDVVISSQTIFFYSLIHGNRQSNIVVFLSRPYWNRAVGCWLSSQVRNYILWWLSMTKLIHWNWRVGSAKSANSLLCFWERRAILGLKFWCWSDMYELTSTNSPSAVHIGMRMESAPVNFVLTVGNSSIRL